ncbi:MAG: FAD-dependent oxidoreductase, partial [Prevotellaceae bacterium]|nr:FAD-dependent oxidoreductase [Prevotellaceae bacterium]
EMLNEEFKDYVVLGTTGATPKEIETFKAFGNTMTADEVLSGQKFPGKKIIVIGGGSVGCETADYLAPLINDLFPANRDVSIIEMTNQLMVGEGGPAKSKLTRRLMEKGVHIHLNSKVVDVMENSVVYEFEGKEYTLVGDTLIFAVGYNSKPIEDERVIQIGDANKVGNLKDAIADAYAKAKTI